MAAGHRLAPSAALVAFISILFKSKAERQVADLEGGRLAVVVQHRHLERAAGKSHRRRRTARADGAAEYATLSVEQLEKQLEMLNKTVVHSQSIRKRGNALKELVKLREPRAAKVALRVLLRAVTEDRVPSVRKAALRVLRELKGPEVAECALPVLLRVISKDDDQDVRAEALKNVPRFQGPEGDKRASLVVLRVAAEDTEKVRAAAIKTLTYLKDPGATERALPVALKAATDEDPNVRLQAMRSIGALLGLLALLGPASFERAALSKFRDFFEDIHEQDNSLKRRKLQASEKVAEFLCSLEPAVLELAVPTLVWALKKALPFISRDCKNAMNFAVTVGRALAKVAFAAGPDALDILIQVEERSKHNKQSHLIQLSRETVQRILEAKCATSFVNQSGVDTKVENITITVPLGVMMVSSASDTQAHRCPNPDTCSVPRHKRIRPADANATKFKEGRCPLLLSVPPGSSHEATDEDSPMCTAGFDPTSPGCSKCLPDFGRKNTDPFSCELCHKLDWGEQWAIWLVQPLLIFLFSLRSAENAVASKGMAEALANDVVKIGLAYLSTIGVIFSTVTSTAAYHELRASANNLPIEMLLLTQQTAQRGDVTYSSSSDCLLMKGKGPASVYQLLALSVQLPACVLAVVATLIVIRAVCRAAFSSNIFSFKDIRAEVVNSLVTCSLVAGNQFLPGVASACMRALPCFHTQAAVDGERLIQFMAYDPDTACSERTQLLASCGTVLVFAFVVGPVYWLIMLHRQQGVQQTGPMRFLTGSYRIDFHWWEAGRLTKTMLIACVVAASPASYCPLQQLNLCLLVAGGFALWHCYNAPYKYVVLNVAEASALATLSAGMVLSGLLAGGQWALTPGFRRNIIIGIAVVLSLCFLGLAALWLKVKFFWAEGHDEELAAEDSRDDGQRESDAP